MHPFQPVCYPSGFTSKTDLSVKGKKPAIAIHDIEANAELKLTKTNRAKGDRPGVALLQVIGSIKDALEENAMLQGKHVVRFVDQHLAASPQQDLLIILPTLITVKGGIITGKAKDPDTFPKRGLTEDEIPRRMRIEVLHGDCQNAKRISRKLLFEECQNITGQDLPISGNRVYASCKGAAGDR